MKGLKKVVAVALCAATAATFAAGISACSPDESSGEFSYTVAMPDGAPALAAARLMVEDMQFGGEVNYTVVNSNAITQQVSGGVADICILPVNAAVQLAGSGETYSLLGTVTHGNLYYSLLGTVTHGNLYMLSAKHPDEQITVSNLDTLVGKTVGCIQLSSFVGNVFKIILEDNDIPYTMVESVSDAKSDSVNLINIADPSTGITPAAEFDYMIGAEPLVTAKTTAAPALKIVGDIQALYGENGFPQAVMLAKNSVIEQNGEFIADFISAVEENAEWIASDDADMTAIVNAINANYGGATSSLNANNLNSTVISRCAIEFVSATECRQEITGFIDKLEAVTGTTLTIADKFFYSAN